MSDSGSTLGHHTLDVPLVNSNFTPSSDAVNKKTSQGKSENELSPLRSSIIKDNTRNTEASLQEDGKDLYPELVPRDSILGSNYEECVPNEDQNNRFITHGGKKRRVRRKKDGKFEDSIIRRLTLMTQSFNKTNGSSSQDHQQKIKIDQIRRSIIKMRQNETRESLHTPDLVEDVSKEVSNALYGDNSIFSLPNSFNESINDGFSSQSFRDSEDSNISSSSQLYQVFGRNNTFLDNHYLENKDKSFNSRMNSINYNNDLVKKVDSEKSFFKKLWLAFDFRAQLLSAILLWLIIGILFFMYTQKDDDWQFPQALLYCVNLCMAVGYGAPVPKANSFTNIFTCVFLVGGTTLLVTTVSYFMEYLVEKASKTRIEEKQKLKEQYLADYEAEIKKNKNEEDPMLQRPSTILEKQQRKVEALGDRDQSNEKKNTTYVNRIAFYGIIISICFGIIYGMNIPEWDWSYSLLFTISSLQTTGLINPDTSNTSCYLVSLFLLFAVPMYALGMGKVASTISLKNIEDNALVDLLQQDELYQETFEIYLLNINNDQYRQHLKVSPYKEEVKNTPRQKMDEISEQGHPANLLHIDYTDFLELELLRDGRLNINELRAIQEKFESMYTSQEKSKFKIGKNGLNDDDKKKISTLRKNWKFPNITEPSPRLTVDNYLRRLPKRIREFRYILSKTKSTKFS